MQAPLPSSGGHPIGHRIGYARVSTTDQDLALQRDALAAAGCRRLFTDTMSGAKAARPGLDECLAFLHPGDTLVVWRLDRLGRSLTDLLALAGHLDGAGVHLHSLTEAIDTATPGGRLVFTVFGALAQFERELMVERTKAGLESARARGRVGGRPPALTPDGVAAARTLRAQGSSWPAIATALGVSRSTVIRAVADQ